MPDDYNTFTFRVASSGEISIPRQPSVRYIDLPSEEDALTLFKDFLVHTRSYNLSNMHSPTAHTMIEDIYTQLNQGHAVDLGSVALVLSFCAASAFFWDKDFQSAFDFLTEDNAAAQSHAWRRAAFDLLDQCQRTALKSLEAIHARLVLADLIYNMEGISSRFRYIQSGARAAAYELGLHVVDLPGNESSDSEFLRETKRRIWWYLATTDWLLSASGGPINKAYTVNPKHMRVNLPTYIPGSDQLIPLYGAWSEVVVLHMNVRIQVGQVCRQITDALPLGSGGIETLPYSRVAALDSLYEHILINIPSAFSKLDENYPDDEMARRVALQGSLGRMSLYARRARLLRPLLQANNLPRQFDTLRKTCLDSTEVVMDIASRILSDAVDSPASAGSRVATDSRRSPYRGGLLINHLFMACTVLATDPALRGDGPEGSPNTDAGTERRRAALANACRLLEKTGEKSAMAAGMVRSLVSVLRKHHVHVVETGGPGALGSRTFAMPDQKSAQKPQPQAPIEQQVTKEPQSFVASQQQPVPPDWGYEMVDPNGLSGIWNDFLGMNPADDGWQQLFTDLDSSAGGSIY
ncbi:hypothetical protein VMCG_08564 [Cytospora schulzeri]|uniref:Xylanolytic transcriptional activator regulatory domain-containing protein n=1 Tax=Cytospora schulzeri TaxID=448051 RepID=A0A423VVV8_9PEZI|nr:hypothetical protein VMCG_08564 [Valsa malicola]